MSSSTKRLSFSRKKHVKNTSKTKSAKAAKQTDQKKKKRTSGQDMVPLRGTSITDPSKYGGRRAQGW